MTRIVGVFIILAGLALFAYGSIPVIAMVAALALGKPIPYFRGNSGLLIGGGLAVMAYGWQCVKGFKNK